MKWQHRWFVIALVSGISWGCHHNNDRVKQVTNIKKATVILKNSDIGHYTISENTDTVIYGSQTIDVFNDKSFQLSYHVSKAKTYNDNENNAVLIFTHTVKGKILVLFKDPLYSMHNYIEFHDMNDDGIKDILISCYSGARANPTYYLYLRDTVKQKLVRVSGFERIRDPELDTVNNIITSGALYGNKVWIDLYRITKDNKLVNFNLGYEQIAGMDDDRYEKTIRRIAKRYGTK